MVGRDRLFGTVAIWKIISIFYMKNHLYNEDRSSKHSKVNSGLNLQSLKQYKQGRYKNITPNLHNGDDSK